MEMRPKKPHFLAYFLSKYSLQSDLFLRMEELLPVKAAQSSKEIPDIFIGEVKERGVWCSVPRGGIALPLRRKCAVVWIVQTQRLGLSKHCQLPQRRPKSVTNEL